MKLRNPSVIVLGAMIRALTLTQAKLRNRLLRGALLFALAGTLAAPVAAQLVQQGGKLAGTDASAPAYQGSSVALSADGNTAIVGGYMDAANRGAAWVYARDSSGRWSQQGPKLVGSGGGSGVNYQGIRVAISADGNTALVGGSGDNDGVGAAWVFTRAGGVWSQQGDKLVGSGAVGRAGKGFAVALSANGNTALVGGYGDSNFIGAAWVWTRSAGVWTQQTKLAGSGWQGDYAEQGFGVALSADGNTALLGGRFDNYNAGAAWVFTRDSSGRWSQQGGKLVGGGAAGAAQQGWSVALSADGNTALVHGGADNNYTGAAWVWTRSNGAWSQQGGKLVGNDFSGQQQQVDQGHAAGLSADGNTAAFGRAIDNGGAGAVWMFTRDARGTWTQLGNKLVGGGAAGPSYQGYSAALSADGRTLVAGGPFDGGKTGAAWVFAVNPALAVSATSLQFACTAGGAAPAAQAVQVGNSGSGTLAWSATTSASWLAVTPASGTAPSAVSVQISPAGLGAGSYTGTVTIASPGLPSQAITVTLTVTAAAPAGPQISAGGVFNGATFQTGGIAPNEFIAIKGAGLGPAAGVASAPTTSLAGTKVYVGGTAALLTYSQDGQVNALAPFGLAGTGSATVQAEFNGVRGNTVTVPVADSSPGIFTQDYGPGQAWMVNQDQTFNSASNPAARNTYVAFWATGQGLVDVPLQDGARPEGPPFPNPLLPVSVTLGGVKVPDANVVFKGLVYPGEIQVNVLIPENAPTGGAVSLVLTIGAASSRPGVTIGVK